MFAKPKWRQRRSPDSPTSSGDAPNLLPSPFPVTYPSNSKTELPDGRPRSLLDPEGSLLPRPSTRSLWRQTTYVETSFPFFHRPHAGSCPRPDSGLCLLLVCGRMDHLCRTTITHRHEHASNTSRPEQFVGATWEFTNQSDHAHKQTGHAKGCSRGRCDAKESPTCQLFRLPFDVHHHWRQHNESVILLNCRMLVEPHAAALAVHANARTQFSPSLPAMSQIVANEFGPVEPRRRSRRQGSRSTPSRGAIASMDTHYRSTPIGTGSV